MLTDGQTARADHPVSSTATVNLQSSVARMNGWLRGSAHAGGWRHYLKLNQLDAQSALGEYADVSALQEVLRRFSGDVRGLEKPEFNDVRLALTQQVALLSTDRSVNLTGAVKHAMERYRRVSISDLEAARNEAVYALRLLKRFYRKTMPSRTRAEIFYRLELDEQIEYLESLRFELPPEVSAGKVKSMIRDELEKLKEIEAQIDAMPIDEDEEDEDDYGDDEEDDYGDDEDEDSTETTTSKDDETVPSIPSVLDAGDNRLLGPVLSPPGPDNGKDTLKELESRARILEERITDLKQMFRDLRDEDAGRLETRAKILNRLAGFNSAYKDVAGSQFDPWFVSTALAAENFNFLYFYATDDNLQEEFLKRIAQLSELIEKSSDLSDRTAHGEAGKLLQWLESAGQVPDLVAAIRHQHSLPNFYASVSSGMINALVAENSSDVSRQQRVKEVFFGRIVRGTAHIDGNVSIRLVPDPHQVNLAIELLGSVTSRTYSRERSWCINASAAGTFYGRRQFTASLRGVQASDVESDADMSSSYGGISSNLDLVKRKAAETFQRQKPRNDAESSRRIKNQVTEGFVERTDDALEDAQRGIDDLGDSLEQFARFVPQMFVRTTRDRIELVARKINQGSLAAPTAPASYGRQDEISVALHETMLTNYIDPVFAGKTFTNTQLRTEAEDRFGLEVRPAAQPESTDQDRKEASDEPQEFSITFARVRPVQLEFADNQLSVIISGRRFSQGERSIEAGLRFRLTFRIVRQGGVLKLFRIGNTEIEYADPDQKDAKLIAFRTLLEKRLNEATKADEGVELPANLLPTALVERRPLAESLRLNTLRLDGGWLYLGWSRSWGQMGDLAAIWDEGSLVAPINPVIEGPSDDDQQAPPSPHGNEMEDLQETEQSVLADPAMIEGAVILSGAEAPTLSGTQLLPGQVIEGEIVHEVIVDTMVSETPTSSPLSSGQQ